LVPIDEPQLSPVTLALIEVQPRRVDVFRAPPQVQGGCGSHVRALLSRVPKVPCVLTRWLPHVEVDYSVRQSGVSHGRLRLDGCAANSWLWRPCRRAPQCGFLGQLPERSLVRTCYLLHSLASTIVESVGAPPGVRGRSAVQPGPSSSNLLLLASPSTFAARCRCTRPWRRGSLASALPTVRGRSLHRMHATDRRHSSER
jgi:hypothetical protein